MSQADDHDTTVCAGCKATKIRKIKILRDKKPLRCLRALPDNLIASPPQTFIQHRINIMAERLKIVAQRGGHVLIQFDSHATRGVSGVGRSSSAEAAAKAMAALT